jgi:hypothetical protein
LRVVIAVTRIININIGKANSTLEENSTSEMSIKGFSLAEFISN